MDVAINYLSVLIAAAAIMGVGSVWYGPAFGRYWRRLKGYAPDRAKSIQMSARKAMILATLGALVTAFVLALLIRLLNPIGFGGAFMLALLVWVGFVVPLKANDVLFEEGDWKLFLFHAAQSFVALLVASLILTLWS